MTEKLDLLQIKHWIREEERNRNSEKMVGKFSTYALEKNLYKLNLEDLKDRL